MTEKKKNERVEGSEKVGKPEKKVSGKIKLNNAERVNRLDALLMQIKLSLLMRDALPNSENVIKLEEITAKLRSSDEKDRKVAHAEAEGLVEIFDKKRVETKKELRTIVGHISDLKDDEGVKKVVERIESQKTNIFEKIDAGGEGLTEKEIDEHEVTLNELRTKVGIKESVGGLSLMEEALHSAKGILETRKRLDRPTAYPSPIIERASQFNKGEAAKETDDGTRLQMRSWSWGKKGETEKAIELFKSDVKELHIDKGGKKLRTLDGDELMGWLMRIRDRKADLKSFSGGSREARDNALETLSMLEVEARGAFEQRLRQDLQFDRGSSQEMALEQVVGDVLHDSVGGKFGTSKHKLEFDGNYEKIRAKVSFGVNKMERVVGMPVSEGLPKVEGIATDEVQAMMMEMGGLKERGDQLENKVNTMRVLIERSKINLEDEELMEEIGNKNTGAEKVENIMEGVRGEAKLSPTEQHVLGEFLRGIAGDKEFVDISSRLQYLLDNGRYGQYQGELKTYISKIGLKETSSDWKFAFLLRDAKSNILTVSEDMAEEFEEWQHSLFIPSIKSVSPENIREVFTKIWSASQLDYVTNPEWSNRQAMSVEMVDGSRKTWSPAVIYQLFQRGKHSTEMMNAPVNGNEGAMFNILIEHMFGEGSYQENKVIFDVNGVKIFDYESEFSVRHFDLKDGSLMPAETAEEWSLEKILDESAWMNNRGMKFWAYSGEAGQHARHYAKEDLGNANKWDLSQEQMFEGYGGHFGKWSPPFFQEAKIGHMLTEIRSYKDGSIIKGATRDFLIKGGVEPAKARIFADIMTKKITKYIVVDGKPVKQGLLSHEETRFIGNTFDNSLESWDAARGWLRAHNMPDEMIIDRDTLSSYMVEIRGKDEKALLKGLKGEKLKQMERKIDWVEQADEIYEMCRGLQWTADEKTKLSGFGKSELKPLAERVNTTFGSEWSPENMDEFIEGFEFVAMMDLANYYQGTDPIEYATKYKALAEAVSKVLPKIEQGLATSEDFLELQGSMRAYLPPHEVDGFIENLLRKTIQTHTFQGRAYEVAQLNDDERTINYRKMSAEDGHTYYFIGRDGHRIAKTEMVRGDYFHKRNGTRTWRQSDVETLMQAMTGQGMVTKKIGESILDDLVGGGRSLDKMLGLDGKNLSEKQRVRREVAKKVMARSLRLFKRLPLFDDPAWAAWSFGSEIVNLVLEAGQEVASEAVK